MPTFILRSRYTREDQLTTFLTEKLGRGTFSIQVSLQDRSCLISVPDNPSVDERSFHRHCSATLDTGRPPYRVEVITTPADFE